ncbi:MAG: dihydrofolate reductase family protein [Hyphomonadaceae bacterium]
MASIGAFISLSLDGCYSDARGDMSWAHTQDAEQGEFAASNASGGGRLIFGRITYDMMKPFWTSAQAAQMMPDVAAGMNANPKTVFSRTLGSSDWQNTKVASEDLVSELKVIRDSDLPATILGSGTIVAQAATAGLLDELQVMLVPVTLGAGKRLFDGIPRSLSWRREDVRQFSNGNVFIRYRPN